MTHPPTIHRELLHPEEDSPYLLHDRREILHLLRQVAEQRASITAYYGADHRFFLTALLGCSDSDRRLLLDVGHDHASNEAVLAAERIACATQVNKIKVQFLLGRARRVEHGGRPAFEFALPTAVLRLQRREYFRLIAPVSHALNCQIDLPGRSGKVQTRVLDISAGGLAVVVPPSGVAFEPDMQFPNCRLELPDAGLVSAGLMVRNLFRVTQRNGADLLRAGCQFVNLTPSMEQQIQRYILRVERERKARESEL